MRKLLERRKVETGTFPKNMRSYGVEIVDGDFILSWGRHFIEFYRPEDKPEGAEE